MNSVSGYSSRRDSGPVGWFTGEIQLDLLAVHLASQWHSYRECKHRLPLCSPMSAKGAATLVARGVPVHFLQKLAHCVELRAKAFPVAGLQSFNGMIVTVERLPCLTCRRACDRNFLLRVRDRPHRARLDKQC